MTIELYRSDNLVARARAADRGDRCVVTFDNYGRPGDLDRDGFGELFFAQRDISTVSIVGRGDDWYHYADTVAALSAVRAHVAACPRVVTYGSSMGAYAALRFAQAVGADAVLALSPQYTIRRDKAPFEPRWWLEAARINWVNALETPIAARGAVVVHDSRGPDRHHAALIAAECNATTIGVPFGGHPVATFLADIGLLEQLVMTVLDGTLDAVAFRREVLARRRTSAVHLVELARRLPARRRATAIALARRALAMQPHNELPMHVLATLLTQAREHDEALTLHRNAIDRSDGFLGYRHAYSEALDAAGDRAAALAEARANVADHPTYPHLHNWLGFLLWHSGRYDEAIVEAGEAVRMAPQEVYYMETLALYRRKRSPRGRVKTWLAWLFGIHPRRHR